MFPNINNMKIYLVCGKTDLRKGIDGLAALVTEAFSLDAYDNAIFLFCGTRSDRFKALYWDKTGLVPAKLRLLEHHQAVYKCPECYSDDHSKISKAPMPRSLISHSKTGSPSIVAHIAAMKYVYKVPCYRQEA